MSESDWANQANINTDAALSVGQTAVNDDDDKLSIIYPVRISPRQQRLITAKAEENCMTKQQWIRRAINKSD